MKFINQFEARKPENKRKSPETSDKATSLTIPAQAMGIKEIIRRSQRGEVIMRGKEVFYNENVDFDNEVLHKGDDFFDVVEKVDKINERIKQRNTMRENLNKEKQATKHEVDNDPNENDSPK